MKKNNLWGAAAAASLLLASCGGGQPTGYTVEGRISGLNDGDTVLLVPRSHDREAPVAKAAVAEGQFRFEGTVEEPLLVSLRVKDSYGTLPLMLENTAITVDGSATTSAAHDGTPLYTFEATVKGSPLTARFDSLVAVRDTLTRIRNDFEARYKDFFEAQNKAYEAKDQKKLAELRESDTYKAMAEEDNAFFQRVEKSYNGVILANKETYWGPLLLIELTSYLTEGQKEIYDQFSEEAKQSRYGQLVKSELYPAGQVGSEAIPFTLKDSEGNEVTLASLLEGKRYLLIDFWASWCNPCRKEIPNLKNLYKQYADKGFQIVSISIDKKESEWQKAVKEEGLEWPNYLSDEVATLYKVRAVPTMYLVDGGGILVGVNLRGQALADKLAELFQ